MDSIIPFPEGYRYKSDIELFKKTVDLTKEMIESGKAVIILAQVFMSQDEFEQEYEGIGGNDFIDILDNEIVYLLRQNFEEPIVKDSGLKSYLEKNNVPEEWHEKIIDLNLEKRQYLEKRLGGEREKNRYKLKKYSILKKLSGIDYQLSRTIDKEEVLYTTLKMSVNSTLEDADIPKVVSDILNQCNENITFICDKSDIEYLIKYLERIKQML